MDLLFRSVLGPLWFSGLTAFLWCGTAQAADPRVPAHQPVPVVASFSILGDLVRVVGGDRVVVTSLVGPDADAHIFEPKPSDAKAVAQARLLVTNGLGFEPWATQLAQAAGYRGTSVVASQGVQARTLAQDHGPAQSDPHAWQNPNNVIVYVRNIEVGLSRVDPAGAAMFQRNADAYAQELLALDGFAKTQFATIAAGRRKVITSHDAFGYFGAHYGIQFFAPQGVSTNAEPSAKGVAQLIRQIRREKIKSVFLENMSNPRLLTQLSQDAGVTVGGRLYADALSGPNTPGATYLQMVRHNVTQLTAGMRLN